MGKRRSKAAAKDRQKQTPEAELTTHEVLSSKDANDKEDADYKAICESIQQIRPYFDGRSLRRTLRSKGHADSTVLNMPDPCEMVLLLDLHPREIDLLETAAEDALENSKTDVKWRSVRRSVSHCMTFY